ncbi:hypothetical protein BZA70DRAFT_273769 [Myxozyma melibiosi]|uniref:Uncharacterized protein n=1 Tax=Myxozyma melibiosi TaxID=54550 RepID=A0ABR1FFV6_9ASCO
MHPKRILFAIAGLAVCVAEAHRLPHPLRSSPSSQLSTGAVVALSLLSTVSAVQQDGITVNKDSGPEHIAPEDDIDKKKTAASKESTEPPFLDDGELIRATESTAESTHNGDINDKEMADVHKDVADAISKGDYTSAAEIEEARESKNDPLQQEKEVPEVTMQIFEVRTANHNNGVDNQVDDKEADPASTKEAAKLLESKPEIVDQSEKTVPVSGTSSSEGSKQQSSSSSTKEDDAPKPVAKVVTVRKEIVTEREVEEPPKPKHYPPLQITEGRPYNKKRESVPVSCVRREIEHGEHITSEETGQIIYDAFPACKETGKQLEFPFNVDSDKPSSCTFDLLDETYHLFQLYVHQDAPLSCQVPSRIGSENLNAPLAFSIQGKLETSHLDIATRFTIIFEYIEAVPGKPSAGVNITSAVAYPVAPLNTTRVIIGDELSMQFTTRWFNVGRTPKMGDRQITSFATICYCIASAVVAFSVSAFYFLVVVFPQRARVRSSMRQAVAAGLAPDFSMFTGNGGFSSTKRD